MSAEDFAIKLIFGKLRCRVLIVGENYRFGKGASGGYEMLQRLGEERGVKVIAVPSVLYEEERVSSSRIRRCLIEFLHTVSLWHKRRSAGTVSKDAQ